MWLNWSYCKSWWVGIHRSLQVLNFVGLIVWVDSGYITLVNAALGLGRAQFYCRDILQKNPPNCVSVLYILFFSMYFLLCADTNLVCVKTTVIVAVLFMPSQCSSNEKWIIFYRLCDLNSFAEGFFENKFLIWPEECFGKVAIDASTFHCIL